MQSGIIKVSMICNKILVSQYLHIGIICSKYYNLKLADLEALKSHLLQDAGCLQWMS